LDAVERERGISVSSALMSFEHQGLVFNLLDQEFSGTPNRFRLSADQHAVAIIACYFCIYRRLRSGGCLALEGVGDMPDLNLIKQAQQAAIGARRFGE
jgi:hypothetical protein